MVKKIFIFFLIIFLIGIISAEELNQTYLCKKTFEALQSGISDQKILDDISSKYDNVSLEIIQNYKYNWENICYHLTNLTLKENSLCNSIYYLILDKGYDFTSSDVKNIANDLNLSLSQVGNYISNNYELCFIKGYSAELPKQKFPILNISVIPPCNLDKDSILGVLPLSIEIGKQDCEKIKFWNNFFSYSEFKGYYTFNGIRTFWVLILLVIIFSVMFIKYIKKTNKILNKLTKK